MYQQNQSDMFTNAVDILSSATLRSIDLSGSSGSTLSGNVPVSSTVVAYASGGTFLGSAQLSTAGPGTGVQNNRFGASYLLTTSAGGVINAIIPVQTRPNGSILGAATTTPINPGAGPNLGVIGQTILFNAASITTAFGSGNDGNPITGVLTVTLIGADLQFPRSGTVNGAVESVYEPEPNSGGGFGIYAGVGGNIKVELVGAPANQTVLITGIQPGTIVNGLFRKIYIGANTTATGILALY